MPLTAIDWTVIVLYFVLSVAIALVYSRRAGASADEYFLSGRAVPWWLAGTSMVATTFAADTPLAVTGLTVRYGIAGNWLWWCMVMSGMLTVVFYARLWRRAGVMTDAEFAEIRYSGRPAAFLRGFRACYLALAINSIIIGWVTAAMAKIVGMTLGVGKWQATLGLFVLTALYSTLSGLWGVLFTDFFPFVLAMLGCIALAFFALGADMSTIATQLNWGASYLVNGVYRRFWARGRSERHYAAAGRLATLVMMVISGVVTLNIGTVEGAWKFLLAIGAGTGLVYLLRWYWWRVNAWSEVSAMAAALVFSLVAQLGFGLSADDPRGFARLLLVTTAATTVVWLMVTYLTPAEPLESLRAFHRRVRAGGPGVRAVGPAAAGGVAIGAGLVQWLLGCAVVYLALFGIGGLVLGRRRSGALAVVAAVLLTG